MSRTLALATALAAVLTLPAIAEDASTKVDPTTGPTSTMSEKSAPAANTTAATPTEQNASMTLTVQEGMNWIDKPVYSSDGKKIGEIAAFQRDADNKVIGMHADVGGLFGFGKSRVNLTPAQFKLQGDRAVLSLTAAQAKDLPRVVQL